MHQQRGWRTLGLPLSAAEPAVSERPTAGCSDALGGRRMLKLTWDPDTPDRGEVKS